MDFNFMNLVWGGAAFGFITSTWSYIKTVLWKFCNLFVQQIEIHDQVTADAVISYIVGGYSRSPLYDKIYSSKYEYIKCGKTYGYIPFEQFGKRSMVFWTRWLMPFIVHGPQKPDKGNGSNGNVAVNNGTQEVFAYVTFIRGTLNIDHVIAEAVRKKNELTWNSETKKEEAKSRFFIKHIPDIEESPREGNAPSIYGTWWSQTDQYRILGYSPDDIGAGKDDTVSSLEQLIFPARVRKLIEEIKLWRNNKDWYQKRSIPWKRGWLLYGPPGTGKTALARAFAEDLDMPIYVFDLAELGNHEFMRAWLKMKQSAPCVALIEDIDNIFDGRENISSSRRTSFMSIFRRKEKNGNNGEISEGQDKKKDDDWGGGTLSFDVLLNCLDGIERSEGIFTIITTNNLSRIDSALGQPRKLPDGSVEFISTRPGRIDKAIELTFMEAEDKRRLALRILGEYPDAYAEMLEFIDKFQDLQETPAQFQERCAQIALVCFWELEHGKSALQIADDTELRLSA